MTRWSRSEGIAESPQALLARREPLPQRHVSLSGCRESGCRAAHQVRWGGHLPLRAGALSPGLDVGIPAGDLRPPAPQFRTLDLLVWGMSLVTCTHRLVSAPRARRGLQTDQAPHAARSLWATGDCARGEGLRPREARRAPRHAGLGGLAEAQCPTCAVGAARRGACPLETGAFSVWGRGPHESPRAAAAVWLGGPQSPPG